MSRYSEKKEEEEKDRDKEDYCATQEATHKNEYKLAAFFF
jgi:hypothetical protein